MNCRCDEFFDPTEIDDEWLLETGWRPSSDGDLRYFSRVLSAESGKGAIVELAIDNHQAFDGNDVWQIAFLQGVPDDPLVETDHVLLTSRTFRTRGELLLFLDVVGG